MMQQIKNYLNKYNNASLWIDARMVLEEKKKTIHAEPEMEARTEEVWHPTTYSGQIVFSHYDGGHTQEERNKIRELYTELDSLIIIPRLAI